MWLVNKYQNIYKIKSLLILFKLGDVEIKSIAQTKELLADFTNIISEMGCTNF